MRGELSYVPVLLNAYVVNQKNRDASSILDFIARLVGKYYNEGSEDLVDEVMDRYEELVSKFKPSEVLVFEGPEVAL